MISQNPLPSRQWVLEALAEGVLMFIGTYVCKLDKKGRFTVPKCYREILAENAKDKGVLFFAAADRLRGYTRHGFQEYIDILINQTEPHSREQALRLIRATLSDGMTVCSRFGRVTIPELFLEMYRLTPGMSLSLRGSLQYFEIVELKRGDV